MVNFQKFQFDNFIIGETKVLKPEIKEIIPTIDVERIVEEEMISLPEIPVYVEVEEIKTFQEEEVALQVKRAEEKAYEKGFQAAESERETQNSRLLEEVNNRLLMLVANACEQECKLEDQAVSVACAAIHKLIPMLEKENSKEIVNNFLTDNFKNFKDEAKLAFYFNPDTIPFVQETIARLANIHDFEGKIALHKDSKLGLADCRIEWENGGVERQGNKMLEKVDNLLEEASHKN